MSLRDLQITNPTIFSSKMHYKFIVEVNLTSEFKLQALLSKNISLLFQIQIFSVFLFSSLSKSTFCFELF